MMSAARRSTDTDSFIVRPTVTSIKILNERICGSLCGRACYIATAEFSIKQIINIKYRSKATTVIEVYACCACMVSRGRATN